MDIANLTTRTLIELETNAGMTLSEIMAKATHLDLATGELPPAKVLAGLQFIAGRLSDPAATWDECIDRPLTDLVTLIGGDDSPED